MPYLPSGTLKTGAIGEATFCQMYYRDFNFSPLFYRFWGKLLKIRQMCNSVLSWKVVLGAAASGEIAGRLVYETRPRKDRQLLPPEVGFSFVFHYSPLPLTGDCAGSSTHLFFI